MSDALGSGLARCRRSPCRPWLLAPSRGCPSGCRAAPVALSRLGLLPVLRCLRHDSWRALRIGHPCIWSGFCSLGNISLELRAELMLLHVLPVLLSIDGPGDPSFRHSLSAAVVLHSLLGPFACSQGLVQVLQHTALCLSLTPSRSPCPAHTSRSITRVTFT